MAQIQYELVINASQNKVSRISQDYSVRHQWDTFPEKIELLNGKNEVEKGVRAFVKSKSGLKMEVEFVQVSSEITAIKMTKGPFFIEQFAGSWIFNKYGSGQTHAKFIYYIKVKKWAIPWVTEPMVKWYFSRVVKQRLDALKSYCEVSSFKGISISSI